MRENGNRLVRSLVWTGLTLAVGLVARRLTGEGMETYATLQKPPLAPPPWLFPAVWTLLYVLMGLSAARIADVADSRRRDALFLYGVQLFVNFWWPILFFRLEQRGAAFLWLLLLVYLVVRMIRSFAPLDRRATYYNVPSVVWLLFAGYLNLAAWLLNK